MKNYSECYYKEIVLEESSFASIFVVGNSIYILGNIDIEHPSVVAELKDIQDGIFEGGRDLVNIIYSSDVNVYNVYKEDSEAQQLLEDINKTDFRKLDIGVPDLPDFDNLGKCVGDILNQ